jgi:hypothetical protein
LGDKKIQRLCDAQARGIVIDVTKLENWKLELSKYEIEQSKGAILRSKAIWATEGDRLHLLQYLLLVSHITFVFYSEYKKNISSFLLLNWKKIILNIF